MSLCSFHWEPQCENKHGSQSEDEIHLREEDKHMNASQPERIDLLANQVSVHYCSIIMY